MIEKNPAGPRKVLLSLVAGLLLVGWCYFQALPGYWLYDDWPNLAGLSEVHDLLSAVHFTLSGVAGELGRPLALATFVLQAGSWDQNPAAMLQVNFLIHLLAMIACFLFVVGLVYIRLGRNQYVQAQWVGLATALLWGLSPFLATTHLMVIQRMTSLSGLFTLLGVAAFAWAHIYSARQHDRRALLLLIAGPGLMTLLATLSKENGALLPLLACLIMWIWIPREYRFTRASCRLLGFVLVIVPTFLLVGYLLHGLVETLSRGTYGARRYFSPAERLMTQPVVLWDYLRLLFLPQASAVNPFMDHFTASKSWFDPPATFFASAFWGSVLVAAIVFRRRIPAIAFGVLFFLCGHLIESTYIGLELYFAHRNYVPAVGLYFSLAYTVIRYSGNLRNLLKCMLGAYILFFSIVLFYTSSAWNNGVVNGVMWVQQNPNSIRSAQFLANRYSSSGDYVGARNALDAAAQRHPDSVLLQIQSLNNCVHEENKFDEKKKAVIENLRTTRILAPLAAYELSNMAELELQAPLCLSRTPNVIVELADALLENPVYQRNTFARSKLHLARAFVFSHLDRDTESAQEFIASFRARPDLDVAFYGTALMANLGDYEMAYQFLDEVEKSAPSRALAREVWSQRLKGYREIIAESETIDKQQATHE